MPQPATLGSIKTGRYYVRVPEENVAEIDGYIRESGMYQVHFLSNALVVGAREMVSQRRKFAIQQAIAGEH